MKHCHAIYSKKAQMKTQQMAFILVAIVIFFVMVGILYLSVSLSGLRQGAQDLKENEAKIMISGLSSTAEFVSPIKDCSNCIDLDKVFILKSRRAYDDFWDLDFLQIQRVYPKMKKIECDMFNYPNCDTITLIDNEYIGTPSTAYVSICYWSQEKGGYTKCELGKIYASGSVLAD